MPLKKSDGNMYPWVTHTHSHLAGVCPHGCAYCYVQAMERRFHSGRYTGPVRLDDSELLVNYGKNRTIFIEHMNDIAAVGVQDEWIGAILAHCSQYPENTYVFQSKNPVRLNWWLRDLPPQFMIGTTIERTNQAEPATSVPDPCVRAAGMMAIRHYAPAATLFVTIEPIQEEVDIPTLLSWLRAIRPNFVNIGADSKGHNLKEPPAETVRALIAGIQQLGLEIRQKTNLERLLAE